MKRREFIGGLGSSAAWPLAGWAQQAEQMRRLSVLMSFSENDPEGQARLAALSRGLRERLRDALAGARQAPAECAEGRAD